LKQANKIESFISKEKKINLYWFENLSTFTKYRTGVNFDSLASDGLKNKVLEVNQKNK